MDYIYEILLLSVVCALIVYLLATKDDVFVRARDMPKPDKSKKLVINYYGWKGPMFVEDFTNFTCDNPNQEVVPVDRPNPYLGNNKDDKCDVPKYNKSRKFKYCHKASMDKCRVPTLTAEQDWYNEYWNSTYLMMPPSDRGDLCHGPDWRKGDPGNYRQATNNNLDAPNNLKCQSRSINKDYCDTVDKVSPNCYVTELNACLDEMLPDRHHN